MPRFRQVGPILRMVTLLLLMLALTSCCLFRKPAIITLQGNQAVKLPQGASAPFSGWLLQDEALARILETAEACQDKGAK